MQPHLSSTLKLSVKEQPVGQKRAHLQTNQRPHKTKQIKALKAETTQIKDRDPPFKIRKPAFKESEQVELIALQNPELSAIEKPA